MSAGREIDFHVEAWKLISAYKRRGVLAFHVPNGERRAGRTAARLKAMGVVPGVSDFVLVVNGHPHFIELKTGKGRLSREQDNFLADAEAAGCSAHVARSMSELAAILDGAGALRIRLKHCVHGGHGAQPDTEGAEALG